MKRKAEQIRPKYHKPYDELNELLVDFYLEMGSRIFYKRDEEHWTGWNDKYRMLPRLRKRIVDNANQGHWVDVANLAMFAWNLRMKKK